MSEAGKGILSDEKNAGQALIGAGAVLFIVSILAGFSIALGNSKAGSYFFVIPFFVMAGLLAVIGRHYQKKYQILGQTPLHLKGSCCVIGQETPVKITVCKPNFERVHELKLVCWRRQSSSNQSGYQEVWSDRFAVSKSTNSEQTLLCATIIVPEGKKPTTRSLLASNKYHWELSFEYVDSMSLIKRTWKLPVVST